MLQLALTVSIYLLIVIPAGVYLYHIAAGKHTFADPVFDRVDGAIYKISGVDPAVRQFCQRPVRYFFPGIFCFRGAAVCVLHLPGV